MRQSTRQVHEDYTMSAMFDQITELHLPKQRGWATDGVLEDR
jgi:hypothetical protein